MWKEMRAENEVVDKNQSEFETSRLAHLLGRQLKILKTIRDPKEDPEEDFWMFAQSPPHFASSALSSGFIYSRRKTKIPLTLLPLLNWTSLYLPRRVRDGDWYRVFMGRKAWLAQLQGRRSLFEYGPGLYLNFSIFWKIYKRRGSLVSFLLEDTACSVSLLHITNTANDIKLQKSCKT